MEITHMVLKIKDVKAVCPAHQIATLQAVGSLVYKHRLDTGRDPEPEYIVVNRDEPYSGNVVAVLRENGHWDEPQTGTEVQP